MQNKSSTANLKKTPRLAKSSRLTKSFHLTKSSQAWFIYILECANGKLYTGITTDLQKRFRRHASGKGAKFTKFNKPLRIMGAKPCKDRSEASKLEWATKRLTPVQKRSTAAQWCQSYPAALASAVDPSLRS